MENKEQEEPEVITFKEILERHKDMEEEERHKIVLVCKNCGHQDLLKNFIKKKDKYERLKKPYEPKPHNLDDWEPNPWNPTPLPYKIPPRRRRQPYYKCAENDKKVMMTIIMTDNKEYEDMFFCPKCGSSLVCLNPKFVKNNIARAL